MKKTILFIILAVCLCACGNDDSRIHCGDYHVSDMTFGADGAVLHAVVNDVPVNFYLVVSASGAKYDGVIDAHHAVLWSHGDTWTMFIDEGAAIECK